MHTPERWQLLLRVMLFGIAYFVIGIAFASLANSATSGQVRVAWRLTAYLVSACVFAAHVAYEHFRRLNPPRATALHAAMAAALGAFALAVAANLHSRSGDSGHERLLTLALVLWPAVTAVLAFLVTRAATAILARRRRNV